MRRLCAAALERVVARSPDVRAAQAGVAGAAAALAVTMAVRLNGAPAAKARGQQTLVDAAAGMALNDARGIVEQAVGDDVAAGTTCSRPKRCSRSSAATSPHDPIASR